MIFVASVLPSACSFLRKITEMIWISINNEPVDQNPDIIWLGDAWICDKQMKHHSAFCRSKTNLNLKTFMGIKCEDRKERIGYSWIFTRLNRMMMMMAEAIWFHLRDENEHSTKLCLPYPSAIFITRCEQDVRAERITSLASILTPTTLRNVRILLQKTSQTDATCAKKRSRAKYVTRVCDTTNFVVSLGQTPPKKWFFQEIRR